MQQKKSNNLGAVALVKARELQRLIDILNNTTTGSLSEDITANKNAIITINNSITSMVDSINTNTVALTLVNAKLSALSTLFGLAFDVNGALTTEAYTAHTHSYEDATIADTVDGTGIETSTTKITTGVN